MILLGSILTQVHNYQLWQNKKIKQRKIRNWSKMCFLMVE